ncbi:MAG: lysophospholipid acyltransferase family protein [Microthrixaceae bacterium]
MPTGRTSSSDSDSSAGGAPKQTRPKGPRTTQPPRNSRAAGTGSRSTKTPESESAKPPRDPRINTRVTPRTSEREILSSARRKSDHKRAERTASERTPADTNAGRTNAGRTRTAGRSPSDAVTVDAELGPAAGSALDDLVRDSRAERDARLPVRREPRDDPDDLGEGRVSDVNEWGRSEHMRSLVRRAYDPIYKHWFRVEWEGLEKIPPGGALLVANHAGAIPSDAPAIMHGIETELGRPIYGLADNFFRTVPVVGTLWNRLGGLPAHPDNAYRLLRQQDQLVLVFPEGTKGPAKTFNERYKLRRFGRGGFVEIAMRAGVPVVPIAVVGAEESMPTIVRLPTLAKAFGLPYVPLTANMLVAGPLGTVAYFPAKFKMKVLDPVRFEVPPDQERYSRSRVMDESEAIRDKIQSALYEMLRKRNSVWFG